MYVHTSDVWPAGVVNSGNQQPKAYTFCAKCVWKYWDNCFCDTSSPCGVHEHLCKRYPTSTVPQTIFGVIMSLSEPHISVLKILCVCDEWSIYCTDTALKMWAYLWQHGPIVKRGEATLECQCSSMWDEGAGWGGSQCSSTIAWKGSIVGHQSSWASYLSYQATWLDHWQGEFPGWKVFCATATIYSSAMPICCPY